MKGEKSLFGNDVLKNNNDSILSNFREKDDKIRAEDDKLRKEAEALKMVDDLKDKFKNDSVLSQTFDTIIDFNKTSKGSYVTLKDELEKIALKELEVKNKDIFKNYGDSIRSINDFDKFNSLFLEKKRLEENQVFNNTGSANGLDLTKNPALNRHQKHFKDINFKR